MAPDDQKEIMSQEEIDAYIASETTEKEEKRETQASNQKTETGTSEDMPPSGDNGEDSSQNHIGTPTAQGQQAQEPQAQAGDQKDAETMSQDDIDVLTAQQLQEQPLPDSRVVEQAPEEISQRDIDQLIAQQPQEQETRKPGAVREDSGAVSQDDIDAFIAQQLQEKKQPEPENAWLQRTADEIVSYQQPEGPADIEKDVWEELNRDILSQEEIDALLSGFVGEKPAPAGGLDSVVTQQEKEPPGPVDDITVISRQKHIEIQRTKEENIILEKKKASALLRGLLRMEEERIRRTIARKEELIDEELYARYEITRADRTKMIVSMSEKTVAQYRRMHPGCCVYRI